MIQQRLQNPLATEILKWAFTSESGVGIDCRGDEFTFDPIEQPDPVATLS